MNSPCAGNANLATIAGSTVQLKDGESTLIGCPNSENSKKNNLIVKAHSIGKRRTVPVYVNHVIARCIKGKMEYSSVGRGYELREPSTMICDKGYRPDLIYEDQLNTGCNKFTMYFQVVDGGTKDLYKVQIMDGMLDANNNALFTHISMVS
jgi:hypothetical protein